MSFVDDLLTILLDYSGGYRLMRQRLYGCSDGSKLKKRPRKDYRILVKEAKDATLRRTLSRLKSKGLVVNRDGFWEITDRGRQYVNKKFSDPLNFHQDYGSPKIKKGNSKNLIIAFDIPESYKRARNWLRIELRLLGFEPLQKSVWLGLAPLPKKFIESLNGLGLLRFLKFFEVSETDIV